MNGLNRLFVKGKQGTKKRAWVGKPCGANGNMVAAYLLAELAVDKELA